MITQPESVISTDAQANDVHRWMGTGLDGDNTAPDILRRKLARDLDDKIEVLDDEILASLEDLWGADTQKWRTIDLKSDLRRLNARVANRVLVGLPACEISYCVESLGPLLTGIGRNEQYLASMMGYTTMHARVTLFYHAFPRFVSSLVSGLVRAMTGYYHRKCSQVIVPILRQRIEDMNNSMNNGKKGPPLPSEFMTWLVEWTMRHPDANLSELERKVASHLLVLNIAAIEVTTFALNSAVSDLLRSDKDKHLAPVIKEADTTLRRCNFHPEKDDVRDMVVIERALRESLRRGVQVGFMRQVVAPQGLELPDGTYLPCKTKVCISALGIHFDEDMYKDPRTWNPDRDLDSSIPPDQNKSDVTMMNRPSETYLSFGLGRRACPGRYIVSYQMRLAVAQIFSRYDIKMVKEKIGKKDVDVVYVRRRSVQ